MTVFKPKFVTFDCYGTLIKFDMAPSAARHFSDRVSEADMPAFTTDFLVIALMKCLAPGNPILMLSAMRCSVPVRNGVSPETRRQRCHLHRLRVLGPHPDVPEGLAKVAQHVPLVLLSNSMDDLITHHIPRLGAPIHMAITAEETGAYKTANARL